MKNKPIIRNFDYNRVKPSFNEVSEIIGYPQGAEPSFLPEMVEILLEEAKGKTTAAGCYKIFETLNTDVRHGEILFEGGAIHCGTKISRQMKGSDSFALFITTAGRSFDAWIKSKAAIGDLLSEFLCSSIGSVIADKAADEIQEEINQIATRSGKGMTNRYSPGYCNWHVKEQRSLFDLLPAEEIGVTLTPSFLMNPVKSVSGIIGIGRNMKPGPYACEMCNQKDCIVKRARGL